MKPYTLPEAMLLVNTSESPEVLETVIEVIEDKYNYYTSLEFSLIMDMIEYKIEQFYCQM